MTSRGIRNNNPGNIRKSRDKWQGLAEVQKDKEFFTFDSPEYGIRAIARILITFQDKYNDNTIQKIVTRYAPPTENNTMAYGKAVSKETGFPDRMKLDLHTYEHQYPLVKAIIKHENGVQPYDDTIVNRGLTLAGIQVPKKSLTKSRTIRGAAIGAGSTITTGVIDAISQAQEAVTPMVSYLDTAKWVFIFLALVGLGITIYARVTDNRT